MNELGYGLNKRASVVFLKGERTDNIFYIARECCGRRNWIASYGRYLKPNGRFVKKIKHTDRESTFYSGNEAEKFLRKHLEKKGQKIVGSFDDVSSYTTYYYIK